jgi:hypothetical protein
MTGTPPSGEEEDVQNESSRLHVRVPSGLVQGEIGLGTLISRMTAAAGIPPCEACRERAAALDRLVAFGGPERPVNGP